MFTLNKIQYEQEALFEKDILDMDLSLDQVNLPENNDLSVNWTSVLPRFLI